MLIRLSLSLNYGIFQQFMCAPYSVYLINNRIKSIQFRCLIVTSEIYIVHYDFFLIFIQLAVQVRHYKTHLT